MAQTSSRPRLSDKLPRALLALLCAALLAPGEGALLAQETPAPNAQETVTKLPPDQLDSLVAPIALYPDPLLAQTLVASTYPLELVQLQQWLAKHKDLKDKALADAVAKEPWDPSIQSMAAVPDVVKRLADDIEWATQLGDAFLDQQGDVMDAVQRMRKKAQDKGALASNEQQKVETKVVEDKTVIVVEQSNPEVVYVPSYSPTVVYGPPAYPYPPVYYPPYAGGALISFGVGMAMGAAIWGGSCCNAGWGGGGNNTININNNNNFNRNTNVSGGNRGQGGNGNWQHNSQHRGGAPYSNKSTASKYGGSARGQSPGSRGQGGAGAGSRGGAAGASNLSGGGAGSRGSSGGGFSGGGGGADRVGSRDMSSGGGSRSSSGGSRSSSSAFGSGSSGGMSGSSARSSSSRGSSSMSSSRGGGGGSRGGGGGGRRR